MMRRMSNLLRDLCSVFTAPFVERHVVAFVERFVQQRPRLGLSRDEAGNLLIELRSNSTLPRIVFAAHMDHPGLVAQDMIDAQTLDARFHGGVLIDYVRGSVVRFLDDQGEVTGTVTDCTPEDPDRPAYPGRVTVRVARRVSPGSPGMFDVGEGRFEISPADARRMTFHSRVCDNLAGAAAALEMLDTLLNSNTAPESPVAVLLTRGEEEGFVGAIAAVLKPMLLRDTDRLVVIECSAAQSYAPQGAGCVVRIGDRTSVFNSSLSYFLTQQADDLSKRDLSFKYQRALMPGGTCEATVYDAFGYIAGSICVPLGNYHNMDTTTKKIAAEFIDMNDWQSMVKLFVSVSLNGHLFSSDNVVLKEKLTKRYKMFQKFLTNLSDENP